MENVGLVPLYFLDTNNISVLIPVEQILPACVCILYHDIAWGNLAMQKERWKEKCDLIFTSCKKVFLVKMLFLTPCIPHWCWNALKKVQLLHWTFLHFLLLWKGAHSDYLQPSFSRHLTVGSFLLYFVHGAVLYFSSLRCGEATNWELNCPRFNGFKEMSTT